MTEEDYATVIQAEGWFRLRRGWYHVDAWDYFGWYDSPRCYATAKECYEKEFVMATEPCSPVNKPGGPKPPGKPMPGSSKPTSPGACSSPSAK